MTHPHRKRRLRSPGRSITRNLKKRPRSIRAAQRIAAGTGKSTRGIKFLAPGPRVRTVGGKTTLARLIKKQPRSGRRKPVSSSLRAFRRAGGRKTPVSAALKVFKRRGRRVERK